MNPHIKKMLLGGAMLFIGWTIIMAAIVELIPQLILVGFLAYALTLIGFATGIYGVVMYVKQGFTN